MTRWAVPFIVSLLLPVIAASVPGGNAKQDLYRYGEYVESDYRIKVDSVCLLSWQWPKLVDPALQCDLMEYFCVGSVSWNRNVDGNDAASASSLSDGPYGDTSRRRFIFRRRTNESVRQIYIRLGW